MPTNPSTSFLHIEAAFTLSTNSFVSAPFGIREVVSINRLRFFHYSSLCALALRVGGLNEENRYTMDYELWGEFFLAGAKVQYTEIPIGIFRSHQDQKTQDNLKQTNSMIDAAENLVMRATILSREVRQEILDELQAYRRAYAEILWKQSGRLARIGIPRPVVTSIRNLRDSLRKTIGSGLAKTK
jgi:hypothetical protein